MHPAEHRILPTCACTSEWRQPGQGQGFLSQNSESEVPHLAAASTVVPKSSPCSAVLPTGCTGVHRKVSGLAGAKLEVHVVLQRDNEPLTGMGGPTFAKAKVLVQSFGNPYMPGDDPVVCNVAWEMEQHACGAALQAPVALSLPRAAQA